MITTVEFVVADGDVSSLTEAVARFLADRIFPASVGDSEKWALSFTANEDYSILLRLVRDDRVGAD